MCILIIAIVSSMAIPQFLLFRRDARTFGDARDLTDLLMLGKMRAAANFTHARIYADLSGQSFHLETWNKTLNMWVTEGGVNPLATGNTFGYGSLGTPPSGTQTSIGQAPPCQALTGGNGTIGSTACVVFNSRGIPVDSTGAPTANDALYLTDTTSVYGVTVAATGSFRLWRTDAGTAGWTIR